MLTFLVLTLAVWRMGHLIAEERGFASSMTKLRALFGVAHEPDGKPLYDPLGEVALDPVSDEEVVELAAHEIARGMVCLWCNTIWFGFAAALVARSREKLSVSQTIAYALALSGGALVVSRFMEKNDA